MPLDATSADSAVVCRLPLTPSGAVGRVGDGDGGVSVLARRKGRVLRPMIKGELPPRGARLAEAVPVEQMAACELSLPFGRCAKSYRVLPSQLDLRVPFAIEESAYAFAESGIKGSDRVVGVAVRAQQMRTLISGSEGDGPHVVDSEALALWDQSLETLMPANAEESRLVLHLHAGRVVVVAGSGWRYMGAQVLPELTEPVLRRFVVAHFGVARVSPWLAHVTGGDAASWRGTIHDVIEATGGRLVETADPELFLARSLARRALGQGRYLLNLRAGMWQHPASAVAMRRARRTAATVLGVAGVTLAATGVMLGGVSARRQRALEEMLTMKAQQVGHGLVSVRGEAMIEQLSRGVVADEARTLQLGRIAGQGYEVLVGALSGEVSTLGIELRVLSLDSGSLMLEGVAGGDAAVSGLEGWLVARGIADLDVQKRREQGGGVSLVLTGRLP